MSIYSMQELALIAATDIKDHPGVDGVFILVLSKSDNQYGTAMLAPTVEIDIMFATGVEALLTLRKRAIDNAIPLPSALTSPPPTPS